MKHKAILLIDFDETIAFSNYPDILDLVPGAKETINKLFDEGFYIIINTCRSGKEEIKVFNFLKENGVNFHLINKNHKGILTFFKDDSRKICGDLHFDDKNIEATYKRIVTSNILEYYEEYWLSKYKMVQELINHPDFRSVLKVLEK